MPVIDEGFEEYSARAQEAFKSGKRQALLWFIRSCFARNMPVPRWAKRAFYDLMDEITWRDGVQSWDDIFGPLYEKGKQPAAEQRRRQISFLLDDRVRERHEAGEPISKGLFEAVGKEFGIGATLAEKIYRRSR